MLMMRASGGVSAFNGEMRHRRRERIAPEGEVTFHVLLHLDLREPSARRATKVGFGSMVGDLFGAALRARREAGRHDRGCRLAGGVGCRRQAARRQLG